ncbi:hypothetical protein K701_26695 [Streptomyces fradiae ATCC 10745 = DSM 40063]|uniref:Uncharacterized protein n=2 Tax=Streptomyces fradiae ATCC 10745 = DSM 40063 TaxID=1319510 RepID=A0ABQ6XM02_STRFR|nr:hypothetical protein K701_26695 [Streptomyces fradiae ATCC 10745 = DSM 40063]
MVMDAEARTHTRVHGLQYAVAVLAALGTAGPCLLLMDTAVGGLALVTAAPVAAPLLLARWPFAFAWTCLLLGAGLCVWAFIGAMGGMSFFLPTAMLLLIAPAVGPRPGPFTRRGRPRRTR